MSTTNPLRQPVSHGNPYDFYRYYPISDRDRDWGLYVFAGGSQTLGPGIVRDIHPPPNEYLWEQGRILPDQFGALCYTEGRSTEFESEATGAVSLELGDVFLLFPGVWHRYRAAAESRSTHVWLKFGGPFARQLLRRKLISPRKAVLRTGFNEMILQAYKRFLNNLAVEPAGLQQLLAANVMEILGASLAAERSAQTVGSFGDAVRHAIRLLEKRVEQIVDLEQLAASLGLAYDRFRHIFKQQTGLAPYQYHLQLRINRAKELLRGTPLPAREIASLLHFDDPYHFSKIFKKKTGFSPTEWRTRTISRPSH